MEKAFFMIFDFGVTMLFLIMILFLGIFAVHLNQYNTFKDQASSIISRTGGFNRNAQNQINEFAEKHYQAGGVYNSETTPERAYKAAMFHVYPVHTTDINDNSTSTINGKNFHTNKYNQSVPYGRRIYYRVQARIPFIPQFGKDSVLGPYGKTANNGNGEIEVARSEVRQDSQASYN